ncbi:hypothetical protein [Brevibacillus agri]|uniref:hypothetical protein n=1 Tax=Brevibacillus agri TaxID=51101 RepID=UPI0018CE3E0F|nr:hypothetical protein [Brevibacillus agri]MBG9564891.1 hypothetical protein [Brevibacillus agri]
MIVARWQNKNISLKKMREFSSTNWKAGIGATGETLGGICATKDVGYLWALVDKTRYNHDIKDNRMGEIVIFEAIDTGERCMDGEPIVNPVKVITRIDGYNFWYDGKRRKETYVEVEKYLQQ